MPTAEAHVETDRPSRYLRHLCKHFANQGRHLSHRPSTHDTEGHRSDESHTSAQTHSAAETRPDRIHVEWTDTAGTLQLPWGTCTLAAVPGELTLRVQSPDEEGLRRLQDLVTTHVRRFSGRDPLRVDWQRSQEAG